MTSDASEFLPGDDLPGPTGSGQVTVAELTWALIDDQINHDEFQLLENMLLSDDDARSDYLNCMQLHTDLMAHFAKPVEETATGKSPVLGFLNQGVPPFDVQPSQQ